jgi:hypothetical protein
VCLECGKSSAPSVRLGFRASRCHPPTSRRRSGGRSRLVSSAKRWQVGPEPAAIWRMSVCYVYTPVCQDMPYERSCGCRAWFKGSLRACR